MTLLLFDALLQCPLSSVLQTLVLGQHNLNDFTIGSNVCHPTELASERKKLEDSVSRYDWTAGFSTYHHVFKSLPPSLFPSLPPFLPSSSSLPSPFLPPSLFLSPSLPPSLPPSLSLSSYLSLVPTELLSAEAVTGETGIEHYLIEAHQQVRTTTCCVLCAYVRIYVHIQIITVCHPGLTHTRMDRY